MISFLINYDVSGVVATATGVTSGLDSSVPAATQRTGHSSEGF